MNLVHIHTQTDTDRDRWYVLAYLDELAFITRDIVITGDLNFQLVNKSNSDARLFNSILESHGLRQYVTGAIHKFGHPLDVDISREL